MAPTSPGTVLPHHFGVTVEGTDVRTIDDDGLRELFDVLHEHRFVVLPAQDLTNEQYVGFGRRWGTPVQLIARRNTLGDFPEMIVQSNRAEVRTRSRNSANHWHCDSSYEAQAATFTMLYGVEAPDDGGETLFADLVAAYEALPAEQRALYDSLRVLHATSAATPLPDEYISDPRSLPAEQRKDIVLPDPVTHPLVARHPVSGRRALYGLGGSAYGIVGWSAEEGGELIIQLRRHATQERFRSHHKLMPGEVLIWDNFGVMHRATPIEYTDEPGRRRLNYRISLKGVPDFR